MGKNTDIAWCHHTFNSWWGCVKISDGCKNCYAETFAKRTGNNVWGVDAPRRFFGQKHWNEPLAWNGAAKGKELVFCSSMADIFETHKDQIYQDAMNEARMRLAWTIEKTVNLNWLLLTKRIENAKEYLGMMFDDFSLPENLWLGYTVENQKAADKIHYLTDIPATVRFLSCEPLLEAVDLDLLYSGIDWVIVGGESGPRYRPFDPDWARGILLECRGTGTAFFMKQIGGHPSKRDKLEDLPVDLRIREYPL